MLWNGILAGLIFGLIIEGSTAIAMVLYKRWPLYRWFAWIPTILGLLLVYRPIRHLGFASGHIDPVFLVSWVITTLVIVFGIPAFLQRRR